VGNQHASFPLPFPSPGGATEEFAGDFCRPSGAWEKPKGGEIGRFARRPTADAVGYILSPLRGSMRMRV